MQNITDLLLKSPLPPSSPVSDYWNNIGDMKNWGWEFNIKSINIDRPLRKFKWTTDVNFTTNDTKVESLIDQVGSSVTRGYSNAGTIIMEDTRLWCYYMAEFAYLDEEHGVDMIYEIDQDKWENEGIVEKTGNVIPATQTNMAENKVIHEDKTPFPRYYGGLSNRVEYRGFDFNFRFYYAGGHYIYDYVEQRATHVGTGDNMLISDLVDNSWTEDNKDAKYPRLTWNYKYDWEMDENYNWVQSQGNVNYNNKSTQYSRYLYKGDYLRLKSLELGYTIKSDLISNMNINRLRIYFNATNLFTWAFHYDGWDPETGSTNLPPVRTFNVGVNLGF